MSAPKGAVRAAGRGVSCRNRAGTGRRKVAAWADRPWTATAAFPRKACDLSFNINRPEGIDKALRQMSENGACP